MNFFNYNHPHIIVDAEFLSLPEIDGAITKFKSNGFSVVVVILERLLHRKGRIGMYKNLGQAARFLHMQVRTMIKVIDECGVFVADHEHGLFYSPRLRKDFHMPAYVSRAEAEDIAKNGNVYLGWCKKHSRQKKHETSEKNDASKCEKHAGNSATFEVDSEKEMQMKSEHSKKEGAQSADNQAKSLLHMNRNKNIYNKNIYLSNRKYRKQVSLIFIVDADVDNFYEKKLFLNARDDYYLSPPGTVAQEKKVSVINTG